MYIKNCSKNVVILSHYFKKMYVTTYTKKSKNFLKSYKSYIKIMKS